MEWSTHASWQLYNWPGDEIIHWIRQGEDDDQDDDCKDVLHDQDIVGAGESHEAAGIKDSISIINQLCCGVGLVSPCLAPGCCYWVPGRRHHLLMDIRHRPGLEERIVVNNIIIRWSMVRRWSAGVQWSQCRHTMVTMVLTSWHQQVVTRVWSTMFIIMMLRMSMLMMQGMIQYHARIC